MPATRATRSPSDRFLRARWLALGCGVGLLFAALPATASLPHQGADGRISAADPFAACTRDSGQVGKVYLDTEVEPSADVNPTNPNNIVSVWKQDQWSNAGARGLVGAVTRDGGASWQQVVVRNITLCSGGTPQNGGNFPRAADPWLSFAPNGKLFLSYLALDQRNLPGVFVTTSSDGGLTWARTTRLINDGYFNDKDSVTADPLNANRAYVVWDRAANHRVPVWFSRTLDGGRTWAPARQIFDQGDGRAEIGSIIVPLVNGQLLDVFTLIYNYDSNATYDVAASRSPNFGASWGKRIFIVHEAPKGVTDPDTGAAVRTSFALPSAAVDRSRASPRYGAIYAVWQTGMFSGNRWTDIAYTRSFDGGVTWSTARKINRTPLRVPIPDRQAFTPTVHVAADGTVGVSYYDFRANSRGPSAWTNHWLVTCAPTAFCTKTVNWKESRVSGSFNIELAPWAWGYFLGDYMALAAVGAGFKSIWIQTATRRDPTNAWFASIP